MPAIHVSRRGFLGGMGGLVLALHLPVTGSASTALHDGPLNAFVAIEPDGTIRIQLPSSEMGQGVSTALPMLVAEELDADWSRVLVEAAPAGKDYRAAFGRSKTQLTGGSNSVRAWNLPLRQAGAAARAMLVAAAAATWDVDPAGCTTHASVVHHKASDRSATYGELSSAAALMRPPREPVLKDPEDFHLVGTSAPREDLLAKVTGQAVFGADVKLPDMLFATVVACPVFGGTVLGVDDTAAMKVPGVVAVLMFEEFVAVVGEQWWQAKRALDLLEVDWDEGEHATLSSAGISKTLREALDSRWKVCESHGKAERVLSEAASVVEGTYEVPYLDQATMAPQNTTCRVTVDHCEIWAPTQAQSRAVAAAVRLTGLSEDQIDLHTTYLGGGFGRRGNVDDIKQAVQIAMQLDRPVQLLWTREENFRHGFYRPAMACRLRGAVDGEGALQALHVRVAGDNVLDDLAPKFARRLNVVTDFAMEGLLHGPYRIEHHLVDYAKRKFPVPIGFWRSVGFSHNTFFLESFLDEVAHASGTDPVALRRKLLADSPRHAAVLNRAVKEAGWGDVPEGHTQGVALVEAFGSICAEVAEVSMEDGWPRVHRVTVAIDCGPVVHPDTVDAQMMGGVIFGLSEAFYGKITLQNGRVQQSNFHDYRVLRASEAPQIDTHIIDNPRAPMTGIGELSTPPIAPALCNAIFAATGQRIRSLPLMDALERPA